MATIVEGSKVTVNNGAVDYDQGRTLCSFVFETVYDVIQVNDDRVVIGFFTGDGGYNVTSAIAMDDLEWVGGEDGDPEPEPPSVEPTPSEDIDVDIYKYEDSEISSEGIEDALNKMMETYLDSYHKEASKATMKLFGLPYQFTKYVDNRIWDGTQGYNRVLGRKFIENIVFEAPIMTIVPGKPTYLPNTKKREKAGTSKELLARSTNAMADVFKDSSLPTDLRYYDFQQDYYSYIQYVNIMCRSAAAFLEIGDLKPQGFDKNFKNFDWKDYRWTADSYSKMSSQLIKAGVDAVSGFVQSLKSFGEDCLKLIGIGDGSKKDTVNFYDDTESNDEGMLQAMESLLQNMNFVQFYVDISSSFSESGSNESGESSIKQLMDKGSEAISEIAFLTNSGGIDTEALSKYGEVAIDELNAAMLANTGGSLSTVFQRVFSQTTNIIKGQHIIIPQIYKNSSYSRNYNVTVNLKSPYGNKYSYYMDIMVPLFHLLALVIPKQATANTYEAPFLVKVAYPGVFTCNLGMVDSIQIDKNPSSEAWTIDGLPCDINVTLSITDLYPDLSMTPANSPTLFLTNSSLVDYLAVMCNVDLVQPRLSDKVNMLSNVVTSAFGDIGDNIGNKLLSGAEAAIEKITKLTF